MFIFVNPKSKNLRHQFKNCVLNDSLGSFPCLFRPVNTDWSLTHHSNREVIVYNAVRHRVPSLLLVCGCDIYLPAIQQHLCTVLDVLQDLQEALALIALERIAWDKWDVIRVRNSLCHLFDDFKWLMVKCYQTSTKFLLIHWLYWPILVECQISDTVILSGADVMVHPKPKLQLYNFI